MDPAPPAAQTRFARLRLWGGAALCAGVVLAVGGLSWLAAAAALGVGAAVFTAINASDQRARRAEARAEAAEAATRAGAAAMAAASQSAERALAEVSHELSAPLQGIAGAAEVLRRASADPAHTALLDAMIASAEALSQRLEDLRDVAGLAPGAGQGSGGAIYNPAMVAEEIAAVWRPQAEAKGLGLRIEAHPRLPETVAGDPVRVRVILSHLLAGAVESLHAGEVQLRIAAIAPAGGRRVICWSLRLLGQAGELRGVELARRLALALQGNVSARLILGEGAEIVLETPDLEPPATAKVEATGLNILAADDHDVIRRMLETLLTEHGHRVTLAANGEAAVAAAAAQRFDLILMDVQMPVMDGLRAVMAIRQGGPNAQTPILMLSLHAGKEHRAIGKLAGADGYLLKPIDPDALAKALAQAGEGRTGFAQAA